MPGFCLCCFAQTWHWLTRCHKAEGAGSCRAAADLAQLHRMHSALVCLKYRLHTHASHQHSWSVLAPLLPSEWYALDCKDHHMLRNACNANPISEVSPFEHDDTGSSCTRDYDGSYGTLGCLSLSGPAGAAEDGSHTATLPSAPADSSRSWPFSSLDPSTCSLVMPALCPPTKRAYTCTHPHPGCSRHVWSVGQWTLLPLPEEQAYLQTCESW